MLRFRSQPDRQSPSRVKRLMSPMFAAVLASVFVPVLAFSASAHADWNLSPDSRVSFLSTKNIDVTEVHHFKQLSGTVTSAGNASVRIPLTSVETRIPIRNDRLQKMLFEVDKFATADINAKLPESLMLPLKNGETVVATLPITLRLHGITQSLKADVLATSAHDGQIVVTSLSPVLVRAADFELSAGVEALRKVVGLEAISSTVPVTFTLLFNEAE